MTEKRIMVGRNGGIGDKVTVVLSMMDADEVLRLQQAIQDGTKNHCAIDGYDILEELIEVCGDLHTELMEGK